MAPHNTARLSNILCLFRLRRTASCSDLNQFLTWNKEFEFSPPAQEQDPKSAWAGGLNLDNRSDPIYGLFFSSRPKKDGKWVFGSLDNLSHNGVHRRVQAEKKDSPCDFQLSVSHDTRNPISRSHFAIEISPRVEGSSPIPCLRCLKGSVVVQYVGDSQKSRLLRPGSHLLLSKPVNITCETLQLQMWCPTLTFGEVLDQVILAHEFERDVVTELPDLFPGIGTQIDTRYRNNRVGLKSGNFYVSYEENVSPSTSVIPTCVVWVGNHQLSAIVPPTGKICPRSLKDTVEGFMKVSNYGGYIQHPNILSIWEVAVFRGATHENNLTDAPWLITENLEGAKTLEDWIQPGLTIEIEDRYEIIAQIAAGLDYLRYKGFVHTSLIPENIVILGGLHGEFIAKIAKLEELEKVAGQQYLEDYSDSPTMYTALERFKPPHRYSYPAALYSLGIIALRILTPYDCKMKKHQGLAWNTTETYGRWIKEVVSPSLEQAPHRTQELIKGLLRTLPAKRWTAQECSIFLTEGSLPYREVSSSSSRSQKRKRESLLPLELNIAPVLDKGLIHTPGSNSKAPTKPISNQEAKTTKRVRWQDTLGRGPPLPHISEEDMATEAQEQATDKRRQSIAEVVPKENPKEIHKLPNTLPQENEPEELEENPEDYLPDTQPFDDPPEGLNDVYGAGDEIREEELVSPVH
ncbi:kinase-like domain-containing protein [Xylaria sp. FL1042]|nr:kinase-like domain-containing protein [Xylaria sp. FL1042]